MLSKRVINLAASQRHLLGHGVLMVMQEALEKVEDEQIGIGARQQEAPQAPAILAAQARLGNAVHEPPVEYPRG